MLEMFAVVLGTETAGRAGFSVSYILEVVSEAFIAKRHLCIISLALYNANDVTLGIMNIQ